MLVGVFARTFFLAIVFGASGCVSSAVSEHIGGANEGPAVVAMVSGSLEGEAGQRLVGSGVPRPDGKVITAIHVLRNLPVPVGGLCGQKYEIGGVQIGDDVDKMLASGDIGWLATACDFDRTDLISTKGPPVGTEVAISGFPVRHYQSSKFSLRERAESWVIRGVLVSATEGIVVPDEKAYLVEVEGEWGKDIPGFSGGPCAYKNEEGQWVVFGILVRYFPDPQWSLFGINTNLRSGKKHAVVVIAPIPESFD